VTEHTTELMEASRPETDVRDYASERVSLRFVSARSLRL
jgi:hypothetical protein